LEMPGVSLTPNDYVTMSSVHSAKLKRRGTTLMPLTFVGTDVSPCVASSLLLTRIVSAGLPEKSGLKVEAAPNRSPECVKRLIGVSIRKLGVKCAYR
jgi:hypothetical protein